MIPETNSLPYHNPVSDPVFRGTQTITDVFQSLSLDEQQKPDSHATNVPGVSIDIYTPSSIQHFPIDSSDISEPTVQNLALFSCYKLLNQKDELEKTNLPFGLVLSPTAVLDSPPPCLRKPPVQCTHCSAIINRYCKVDLSTGKWECVFCGKNNNNKEEYGDSSSETVYPELVKLVVEYLDPTQQLITMANSTLDPMCVLLIDTSFSSTDLKSMKDAIRVSLQALQPSVRVGLISFSNIVCVYDVAGSGVAKAQAFSGLYSPKDGTWDKLSTYTAPVQNCLENIMNIMDAIIDSVEHKKSASSHRCLGSAIEFAMAMMGIEEKNRRSVFSSGKIVAFLSGIPNFGPGGVLENQDEQQESFQIEQATNYFKAVGVRCHQSDVEIDIICGGLKQFNIKLIQNLALSNGGTVILQKDFEGQDFSDNLKVIVNRVCGRKGSIEMKFSDQVNVTHIIGSALSSPSDVSKKSSFACLMGSVQPRSNIAVYFNVNDDLINDFVYFQFRVKFINSQNQYVQRIITRRLETTGNRKTFFNSLDIDVIAVLLAKKTVLQARTSEGSEEALDNLDNMLYRILVNCGSKERQGFKLPSELVSLPRKMFLLRRGPLLGPILQHPDDIDYMRCLFLNAPFEDCKRLIEPPFYMAENTEYKYYQVPLEDLALQSNKVLLLDHHSDIFIWSGNLTSGEEFDEQRKNLLALAEELKKYRFPQPQILQFKENSSMARWLQCRLIPSHKDTPEEQLLAFPQLEELPQISRTKLVSKFHRTDDLSYNQYVRGLLKRFG